MNALNRLRARRSFPVAFLPDDVERARQLRAVEERQRLAWDLGGFNADHSIEDLRAAAELYDAVALDWDALGNRSYEARTARHMASSCRERAAR